MLMLKVQPSFSSLDVVCESVKCETLHEDLQLPVCDQC